MIFLATCLLASSAGASDVVVVTATRSPKPLIEEPITLGVMSQGDLVDAMIDHPAEVLNKLPGLMVQAGSGQEHLTSIRSPVLTGGAGAGSFLYLQDGVPLRSAGFANVNGLFDIQLPFARQVEVVSGPGEVTYGSNAVHGVVNALSADPLAEGEGRLRLSAGAFGRHQGTLTLRAAPWSTDDVQQGLLLGGHTYKDGGYRDASGLEQTKAQLAHGWRRGKLSVRTRLHLHRLDQETAGFVRGDDAYKDDSLRRTNPNPEAFRRSDQVVLSSAWQWAGDVWTTNVTPYALATDMAFRMHFLPSQALEQNSHHAFGVLSTASRTLSPKVELLMGADAEAAKGSLTEVQEREDIFSFTQGLHYDYRVTSNSIAPFVRVRYSNTPRLSTQIGVRYTHTRYEYDNRTEDGVVGRFLRPQDRSDKFDAVTGRLAFLYQASEQLGVFGSVSRGARPPQTTDLYRLQRNQSVDGVNIETLDMVELGARYIRNELSMRAVVYAGRKDNFLFRDADGFTVDDGKTTHHGVELSTDYSFTEGWRGFGNVSWSEHVYDFDRQVVSSSETIRQGHEIDTAPKWLAHGGISYEAPEGWGAVVQFTHVGEYFTDAANSNEYPGHTIATLEGHYPITPAVTVRGAIKNLTDERYATRADFAFGSERYFPGEERHLTLAVEAKW